MARWNAGWLFVLRCAERIGMKLLLESKTTTGRKYIDPSYIFEITNNTSEDIAIQNWRDLPPGVELKILDEETGKYIDDLDSVLLDVTEEQKG